MTEPIRSLSTIDALVSALDLDEHQEKTLRSTGARTAEQLYADLNAASIDTLLDDRDERAGVKFKDADLVGIPYRIVTGRSLKQGKLEVVKRADHAAQEIAIDQVVETLKEWIHQELSK